MHPVLERVKATLGDRLRIIKVDVDKRQMIAAQYGIRSVPTLMLMRKGSILWRQSGAMPEASLLDVIKPFISNLK